MAAAFDIISQLVVQAPTNINSVVSDIQRKLSSITATIDLKVSPQALSAIQQINNQLSTLQANLTRVQGTAVSAASSLSQTNAAFERVKTAASAANMEFANSAPQVLKLSSSLEGGSRALENFGLQAGLAARRYSAFLLAGGAIVGIINELRRGVTEAIGFQNQMVKLAQIGGDSSSTLKDLEKTIGNLAIKWGTSSGDLLKAAQRLRQTGESAADVKIELEALAKVAVVPGFSSLESTTEGLIATMHQFKLSAKDAETVLGALNEVGNKYGVQSKDLVEAIKRTGAVFHEAGGSVNELMALFGAIKQETQSSSETIATGLRTILTRIQRPATVEHLRQLGIELRDLRGQFVGPYEAVRKLHDALQGLESTDVRFVSLAQELGGVRQMQVAIPMIRQFSEAQKILQTAQQGSATLTANATQAQDSFLVKITQVREEFFKLIRTITDSTGFRVFLDMTLNLVSGFNKLASALTPLIPLLGALAIMRIGQGAGSLIGGLVGGFQGRSPKFAAGGIVPGVGNTDSYPAVLTPGEFVIKKASAQQIGYDRLHKMNKMAEGGLPEHVAEPTFSSKLHYNLTAKEIEEMKNTKSAQDLSFFGKLSPEDTKSAQGGSPISRLTNEVKRTNIQEGHGVGIIPNILYMITTTGDTGEGIGAAGSNVKEIKLNASGAGINAASRAKLEDFGINKLRGSVNVYMLAREAHNEFNTTFKEPVKQAISNTLSSRFTTARSKGVNFDLNSQQINSVMGTVFEKYVSGLFQVQSTNVANDKFDFAGPFNAPSGLNKLLYPSGGVQGSMGDAKLTYNPENVNSVIGKWVNAFPEKLGQIKKFAEGGVVINVGNPGDYGGIFMQRKGTGQPRPTASISAGRLSGEVLETMLSGVSKATSIRKELGLTGDRSVAIQPRGGNYQIFDKIVGRAWPTQIPVRFKGQPSLHTLSDESGKNFIDFVTPRIQDITKVSTEALLQGTGLPAVSAGNRAAKQIKSAMGDILGHVFEASLVGVSSHLSKGQKDDFDLVNVNNAKLNKLVTPFISENTKYLDAKATLSSTTKNSLVAKAVNAIGHHAASFMTTLDVSQVHTLLPEVERDKKEFMKFRAKLEKKQHFAQGGEVDTVPALLMPGEYVVNKRAAQQIGYQQLEHMNKTGVARFAKGGIVHRADGTPTQPKLESLYSDEYVALQKLEAEMEEIKRRIVEKKRARGEMSGAALSDKENIVARRRARLLESKGYSGEQATEIGRVAAIRESAQTASISPDVGIAARAQTKATAAVSARAEERKAGMDAARQQNSERLDAKYDEIGRQQLEKHEKARIAKLRSPIDQKVSAYATSQGISPSELSETTKRQVELQAFQQTLKDEVAKEKKAIMGTGAVKPPVSGFKYEGMNTRGEERSGFIAAATEVEAQKKLREQGLFVTHLAQHTEKAAKGMKSNVSEIEATRKALEKVNQRSQELAGVLGVSVKKGQNITEVVDRQVKEAGGPPITRMQATKNYFSNLGTRIAQNKGQLASLGLGLAAQYGSEYLNKIAGTSDVAVATGSTDRYENLKAAGGALSGASMGAGIGFMALGPLGAAIGGAVGAVGGFTSALIDAKKDILDSRIKLANENLGRAFGEATRTGRALTQEDFQELDTAHKSALAAQTSQGFVYTTDEERIARTMQAPERVEAARKQTFDASAGGFSQYLQSRARRLTTENMNRPKEEILNQLITENQGNMTNFFGGENTNKFKFERSQLDRTIVQQQRETKARNTEAPITLVTNQLDGMVKALQNVNTSLSDFDRTTQTINHLWQGTIGAVQIANPTEGLTGAGGINPEQYRRSVEDITGSFGEHGQAIKETAFAYDDISRAITAALPKIVAEGDLSKVSQTLPDTLRQTAGGTSAHRMIIGNVEARLGLGGYETAEGTQKLREQLTNPEAFKDHLLAGAKEFETKLHQAGEALIKPTQMFAQAIATYYQRLQQIGEMEDRAAKLEVDAAQLAMRYQAMNEGREGTLALSIPMGQAATATQNRLIAGTGLGAEQGFNPEAIGMRQLEIQGAVIDKQRAFDNMGTRDKSGPAGTEAIEEITMLQAQASNLGKALEHLINPTERLAEIEQRLNIVLKDEESRRRANLTYATGSIEERMELRRGKRAFEKAVAAGGGETLDYTNMSRREIQLSEKFRGVAGQKIYNNRTVEDYGKNVKTREDFLTGPGWAETGGLKQNLMQEGQNVANMAARAAGVKATGSRILAETDRNRTPELNIQTQLNENLQRLSDNISHLSQVIENVVQPQRRAGGGSIFSAKGTDTVPAMLTPGEYVVNRASAMANASLLSRINSAKGPVYLAGGGDIASFIHYGESAKHFAFSRASGMSNLGRYAGRLPGLSSQLDYSGTAMADINRINAMSQEGENFGNVYGHMRAAMGAAGAINPAGHSAQSLVFDKQGRPVGMYVPGTKYIITDKSILDRKNIGRDHLESLASSGKGVVRWQPGYHIQRFASGGMVGTDTVPALLSPGEFVMTASKAKSIGYDNLQKMADGGIVGDTVAKTQINPTVRSTDSGNNIGGSSFASQLQSAFTKFQTTVNSLANTLSKIPPSIQLTATHNVHVIISGGEAFREIESSMRKMVVSQVNTAINNLIEKRFPDVGRLNAAESGTSERQTVMTYDNLAK